MKKAEHEGLFEDLRRLRRAERESAGNSDIATVRIHLEEMLGPAVRLSFAARVLRVSPPALRRWVEKGDVPAVIGIDGTRLIPLAALLELSEAVEQERLAGRKHALEAAVLATHRRAQQMPRNLATPHGQDEGAHGPADLRGLAYHRAVARRLDRSMADMALALVRHWRSRGTIDPRYAQAWEKLLQGPLPDIRKVLEDEGEEARDLRQNSPFAGVLSEAERGVVIGGIE
jgi:hypothetical protein